MASHHHQQQQQQQLLMLVHAVLLVLVRGQVDNGGGGGGSDVASAGEPLSPDMSSWECPRPGRFPNPTDPSCRTYLTCAVVPGTNGSLAGPRQDECWQGALFSGRYQRCITGDDCATLEDFYAIEYECRECGKYVLESSTDCRHFVNCLKTKDPGVFVPIRQRCPDERPLFSPPAHACVPEDEYECDGAPAPPPPPPLPSLLSMPPPPTPAPMTAQVTQVTTTTTTTTTTQATTMAALVRPSGTGHHYLSDLVCLGAGRFPDESVPHCRGYRLCTRPAGTSSPGAALVSRSFLCDPGTVFSEYERHCVPAATYQCPDDTGGTITTTTTDVDRGFRCVAVGRFPDRESPGCERFYRCQRDASLGTLGPPVLERCPPGTIFSWLTTRCVPSAEYVCPVGALTLGRGHGLGLGLEPPRVEGSELLLETGQPEEEAAAREVPEPDSTSRCVRSGRFANEADATCRTYYICTRDRTGAWALVLIRCPAGTVFSRARARCVGSEAFAAAAAQAVTADGDEDAGAEEDRAELDAGSGRDPATVGGCAAGPLIDTQSSEPSTVDGGSGDLGQPPWLTWSATEPLTADASTLDGGDLVLATSPLRPYTPPEYPCTATGRFADINSVDCRSYFLCKLQQPPTHPPPHPADGGDGSQQQQHQHHHHHHHSKQQQQILVSVHMTCPDGMLFSRNTNKCVISNRHVC